MITNKQVTRYLELHSFRLPFPGLNKVNLLIKLHYAMTGMSCAVIVRLEFHETHLSSVFDRLGLPYQGLHLKACTPLRVAKILFGRPSNI